MADANSHRLIGVEHQIIFFIVGHFFFHQWYLSMWFDFWKRLNIDALSCYLMASQYIHSTHPE